jgi:hypothetical protein
MGEEIDIYGDVAAQIKSTTNSAESKPEIEAQVNPIPIQKESEKPFDVKIDLENIKVTASRGLIIQNLNWV